jgi:hypothetical protein
MPNAVILFLSVLPNTDVIDGQITDIIASGHQDQIDRSQILSIYLSSSLSKRLSLDFASEQCRELEKNCVFETDRIFVRNWDRWAALLFVCRRKQGTKEFFVVSLLHDLD